MDYTQIIDILPEWLPWILTGLAFIAALWVALAGLRPFRVTAEAPEPSETDYPEDAPAPGRPPFLSVVVYADESGDLEYFLDRIEEQDMRDREIIVVNDAGHEATAALAERYADRKDLYFTFMPSESRNVSRLKLAYTLGIKAARGEVVLTTSAECLIPSQRWLSEMVAPFRESEFTDVVLGYCRFYCEDMGGARWWREYEDVTTACQWIGSALDGHPYRGDRHNLAFRRRLFFEHDGYSATNHLHTGDDDLFVAAIARGGNTKTVLSYDSILVRFCGEDASKAWIDSKIRYGFTARWLPRRSFRIAGCTRFMQWLAIFGAVLGGTAAWCIWGSPWEALAGVVILGGLWALDISAYRRAAGRLGATRLWWSVVPFMLWQPVAGILFRMAHHEDMIRNFTWQKPR